MTTDERRHFMMAALLLGLCLVALSGCSGQRSLNLRDSFNTLTVEETLGGAISSSHTLVPVGRHANVDALPGARKLAAMYWESDESRYDTSVVDPGKSGPDPAMGAAVRGLVLLSYIGDSSDARFVESIHRDPAFLRMHLTHLKDNSGVTSNFLILGMMAARRVKVAEELVGQMVTPAYWHELGVDELAPPAPCGLSLTYYLAAEALHAYRIGGESDLDEKIEELLEAVEDPIQRQALARRIERILKDRWSEERIATRKVSCCRGFSVRLFMHRLKERFRRKLTSPTAEMRQKWREAYKRNRHLFIESPSAK